MGKMDVHHIFLDVWQAYDSIDQPVLCKGAKLISNLLVDEKDTLLCKLHMPNRHICGRSASAKKIFIGLKNTATNLASEILKIRRKL